MERKEDCLIYPIKPIRVLRENTSDKLIEDTSCDGVLICGSKRILIHSLILSVASNMRCIGSEVNVSQFSLDSVYAFVRFIYLGKDGLDLLGQEVLYELFEMANKYQCTLLIDYCANLITLTFNQQNIQKIKSLAEEYSNTHLEQLFKKDSSDEDYKVSSETPLLERALLKRDYKQVIHDSQLFWQTFCRSFNDVFFHTLEEELADGDVVEDLFFQSLQRGVEEIRKLLVENYGKKIFAFTVSPDFSSIQMDRVDFLVFIEPCLANLAQSLGFNYSSDMAYKQENFSFSWDGKDRPVYPIIPIQVPKKDLFQELYQMVLNEDSSCDCTLKACGGELSVHFPVLSTCGDNVIAKMLNIGMIESREKVIDPIGHVQTSFFRTGLTCLSLLFYIFSNNSNRSASTASSKIAGRP